MGDRYPATAIRAPPDPSRSPRPRSRAPTRRRHANAPSWRVGRRRRLDRDLVDADDLRQCTRPEQGRYSRRQGEDLVLRHPLFFFVLEPANRGEDLTAGAVHLRLFHLHDPLEPGPRGLGYPFGGFRVGAAEQQLDLTVDPDWPGR